MRRLLIKAATLGESVTADCELRQSS